MKSRFGMNRRDWIALSGAGLAVRPGDSQTPTPGAAGRRPRHAAARPVAA